MTTVEAVAIADGPLWDEDIWEDLLVYIEEERVIPIVGPASSTVLANGRTIALEDYVAGRLTSRLGLPSDALPPAPTLNEVVSLYLRRNGRREALYPRIRSIVQDAAFTTPKVLRQLAEIRQFNLFVTTAFDPLLETAINEVRFGGAPRTQTIAYAPNNVRDLETSKRSLIAPTVFHLFGKLSASPSYAISDEDLLEFLNALQSESRRPERLFDELENNHLLIVGGNFSDWVARMFLRAAKRRRLSDPREYSKFSLMTAAAMTRGWSPFSPISARGRRSSTPVPRLLSRPCRKSVASVSAPGTGRRPPEENGPSGTCLTARSSSAMRARISPSCEH